MNDRNFLLKSTASAWIHPCRGQRRSPGFRSGSSFSRSCWISTGSLWSR